MILPIMLYAFCFGRQWHLRTRQIEDIKTLETMVGGFITNSSPFVDSTFTWPGADPGEGPGELAPPPPTPLFLDKTDARRAEKIFFGDFGGLSQSLDPALMALLVFKQFARRN